MKGGMVERYKFDADNNLIINRETPLDDVFDACHALRSETPEHGKFRGNAGIGHRVASVPAHVMLDLKETHGIDVFNMTPEMQRKFRRWLNTEAPKFKTLNAKL